MKRVAQDPKYAENLRKVLRQIKLPDGFKIELFAIVPDARGMAVSRNTATVWVGTLKNTVYSVNDGDMDNVADTVDEFSGSIRFDLPAGACYSPDGFLFIAERNRVMAYDFTTNRMRGIRDYEEPAYWRDVGTIDAYYEANFDTLGEFPKFCMSNPHWPIYANPDQTEAAQVHDGHIGGASLGAGVVIRRAVIERSLLRREVVVEEGAQIADSIIMDRSVIGPGARIRRAIIDQHNFVPAGMKIGYDLEADRQRFHISESGVVVVGKGQLKP